MKIFKIMLIAGFVWSLAGCEDVIDVSLDTAAPRLVIDASIDWEKNTTGSEQRIKLSTTTGYYSNEFPTVSGAVISVADQTGNNFSFIETTGTGEYLCNDFAPVIGQTYTLTIVLNGETYTASETLVSVSDIADNIEQNNEGGMGGDEVEITYYYQDNSAEENYYLHRIIIPEVAFPQFNVEDDENSQGNLIPQFYSHEDLKAGDNVNIRLYGISKRFYDYFNKLKSATGNDDSPFPTTPNAVRGNIVNTTNGTNYPYGYFRLSEIHTKNYTIQ